MQHPIPSEPVDVEAFRALLDSSETERPLLDFLKSAPWVPYWAFCTPGGHDRYAVFEFPLGNQLQCDLLLINSYSGAWEAHFIEFEPAADDVFTKSGVPSKRLAVAQRQVDDWDTFIQQNRDLVRKDMVRYAKTKDRLGYSARGQDPCNFSGDRLADPNTFIHFKFKIVIGRSSSLAAAGRQLVGRYSDHRHAELVTYDRLLRLAEYRYEGKHRDNPLHVFGGAT